MKLRYTLSNITYSIYLILIYLLLIFKRKESNFQLLKPLGNYLFCPKRVSTTNALDKLELDKSIGFRKSLVEIIMASRLVKRMLKGYEKDKAKELSMKNKEQGSSYEVPQCGAIWAVRSGKTWKGVV